MYIHVCICLSLYLLHLVRVPGVHIFLNRKSKRILLLLCTVLEILVSEESSCKCPRECDKTYFLCHPIEDYYHIVDCYIRNPGCLEKQEKWQSSDGQ